MTQLAREDQEDFAVVAQREGACITVKLSGTADSTATDALERALLQIHDARAGVSEVVVDLRDLEFMNSSCLKTVLTWINDIQELPDEAERYAVRFISNRNIHWQARSLHAVRCFATEIITVAYEL